MRESAHAIRRTLTYKGSSLGRAGTRVSRYVGGVVVGVVFAALVASAPVAHAAPENSAFLGTQGRFTMDGQSLNDRAGFAVNVANGNLVLSASDVGIAGRGLSLVVRRVYNARAGAPRRAAGRGWMLSPGPDNTLVTESDGDRTFTGFGGETYRFDRRANGSFAQPVALNAQLAVAGDGTGTITENRSATKYVFESGSPARLVRITDRNNNSISWSYEADGDWTVTDTQGRTVAFTGTGEVLESIDDPTGRGWEYGYDGQQRLESYLDPEEGETLYRYDSAGRVDQVTDPHGNKTRIAYDTSDRVTAITRVVDGTAANDVTTRYAYPAVDGQCPGAVSKTVVTDPLGHATTYCADADRHVTRAINALGHEASSSYTPNGDNERYENFPGTGNAEITQLDFDFEGDDATHNLLGGQFGAGESFSVEYPDTTAAPSKYLATKFTDTEGSDEFYDYDERGNLTRVRDDGAPRNVATLTYNPDGTISSATDGNMHRTAFEYFDGGNLKRVVPPLPMGTTSYTYDALSRVKTVTDGRGVTITLRYDDLDRVVSVRAGDGSEVFYAYDDNGNVERREASTGDVTDYDYDELNRRTDEAFPGGRFNEYAYDKGSNLRSITDASGTTSYGYDQIDRVTSIVAPRPGGGTDTITYSYHDTEEPGQPRSRTQALPGGVTQRGEYDTSGKLTRIVATNSAGIRLRERVYSYTEGADQRSLIQTVTDEGGNRTAYTYRDQVEDVGRLLNARTTNAGGGQVEEFIYGYDRAGNRTERVRRTPAGSTTTSYAYNAANQLCWRLVGVSSNVCGSPPAGATTFSYDPAGHQLTGDNALAWDSLGRLASAGGQAMLNLAPTNGELVGHGPARFQNNLIGLIRENFVDRSDVTSYQRDPDSGLPVSQIKNGEKRFFLQDHLGSTTGLTTPQGALARSYGYDPDGNDTTTGTGTETGIRYAGGHTLTGTGLYHYGARYYDPRTARWTQPDPINQIVDLRQANRYTYAGGDPVNMVDPAGLDIFDVVGDVAKGAAKTAAKCAAGAVGTVVTRRAVIGAGAKLATTEALKQGFRQSVKLTPAGRFITLGGGCVGGVVGISALVG